MARFCDSNQKRGVTLVELIVVLVILAVLAALLVPSLTGYIDKAVEKRIMLQARSLMTAAQATIDEAYAKGELPIDNNGGFEPLNVDTAHKLAKQIIELSELDTQCQWQFSLADTTLIFLPVKLLSCNFATASITLFIASHPEDPLREIPPAGAVYKKPPVCRHGPTATACFFLNPLTMILIHIIHNLAKPDWLVLYQQTAIEELASLF